MLTAEDVTVYQLRGGDLGFSVGGAIKSAAGAVTGAVKTATSAVTGAVKTAGSAAGGAVTDAAGAVSNIVKKAAEAACGLTTNSSVQTGAALTAQYGGMVPHPAGQAASAAGQAVQTAGFICNMAYPPKTASPVPTPPVTASGQAPEGRVMLKTLVPTKLVLAKYKAGSMARFNRTRGVWSIYSPLAGAGLFGAGCTILGNGDVTCTVLGDGEVTPAVPAGFVKAGEELAPPAGVTQAGEEEDKKPFYKNPVYWAIAGGAVALGTGGYFLLRKKSGGLNGARRRRRR